MNNKNYQNQEHNKHLVVKVVNNNLISNKTKQNKKQQYHLLNKYPDN